MTFCIAFKFAQICDKTGNSATPWQIFCHSLHFIKTEEAVELAMSPPTSNSVNNPFLFIFILHLAPFFSLLSSFWKLKNMSTYARDGDRRCNWDSKADGRELCSNMWLISYIWKRDFRILSLFFASDKSEIQKYNQFIQSPAKLIRNNKLKFGLDTFRLTSLSPSL